MCRICDGIRRRVLLFFVQCSHIQLKYRWFHVSWNIIFWCRKKFPLISKISYVYFDKGKFSLSCMRLLTRSLSCFLLLRWTLLLCCLIFLRVYLQFIRYSEWIRAHRSFRNVIWIRQKKLLHSRCDENFINERNVFIWSICWSYSLLYL
jgi:hypothetical protein